MLGGRHLRLGAVRRGVGAEIMRPMAAPVLGGLLVAAEVIDLLLPVIFNWYQCRRWRKLHGQPSLPA
jgi:Cu(I)/Ag(I) efflux system membrane protein CusA/SilA